MQPEGILRVSVFFGDVGTVEPRYKQLIRHGPPIAYSETLLITNIYIYIARNTI